MARVGCAPAHRFLSPVGVGRCRVGTAHQVLSRAGWVGFLISIQLKGRNLLEVVNLKDLPLLTAKMFLSSFSLTP